MVNKKIKKWQQKGDAEKRGNLSLDVSSLLNKTKCKFVLEYGLVLVCLSVLLLPIGTWLACRRRFNADIIDVL